MGDSSVVDVTSSEDTWEVAPFEGVTQDGSPISDESLEGEWWISKTVFTRCPTVCNTMTPNMKKLQDAIQDRDLPIRIVSFTVDPDFDTPERLEDYLEAYEGDGDTWDFVTGYSDEEIESYVDETYRASIAPLPEQDDIMHPTRFYLAGPDGHLVRMYSGDESFDLDDTIEDLEQVVTESSD
ncbi:SCO family protein [Alkalicoccus chagannorensis]